MQKPVLPLNLITISQALVKYDYSENHVCNFVEIKITNATLEKFKSPKDKVNTLSNRCIDVITQTQNVQKIIPPQLWHIVV